MAKLLHKGDIVGSTSNIAQAIKYKNTNVESALDSVSASVDSINDKLAYVYTTAPCEWTYNKRAIKLMKSGNTKSFAIDGLVNIPSGQTTLATFPSDFKSLVTNSALYWDSLCSTGTNTFVKIRLTLLNTGTLMVYNYGANVANLSNEQITITYI